MDPGISQIVLNQERSECQGPKPSIEEERIVAAFQTSFSDNTQQRHIIHKSFMRYIALHLHVHLHLLSITLTFTFRYIHIYFPLHLHYIRLVCITLRTLQSLKSLSTLPLHYIPYQTITLQYIYICHITYNYHCLSSTITMSFHYITWQYLEQN